MDLIHLETFWYSQLALSLVQALTTLHQKIGCSGVGLKRSSALEAATEDEVWHGLVKQKRSSVKEWLQHHYHFGGLLINQNEC